MEYFRQFFIPRLRNSDANILGRKTGKKSAEGDKLHLAVIHIDNDAAAETVIPMHKGIEQCFTNGFFGIVLLIRADNALDRGNSLVAQGEIVDGILKLFENRAAELLAVPELGAELIFENSDLRCVQTLIGKEQGKVGVNIVLRDAEDSIFFLGKLDAVALKCYLCCIKGQLLLQTAGILVIVAIRLFDHLPDLLRRSLYAGCSLPDIHTGRF